MNDYVAYFLLLVALVGLPLAWWRAKSMGQLERDDSKPLFTGKKRSDGKFWQEKLIQYLIAIGLLLLMVYLARVGLV